MNHAQTQSAVRRNARRMRAPATQSRRVIQLRSARGLKRHGRGATLVEVIAWLALVSVFILVSSVLISSISRMTQSAGEQAVTTQRWTRLADRLQQDVWRADAITDTAAGVELAWPAADGQPARRVTWAVLAEGGLSRTAAPAERGRPGEMMFEGFNAEIRLNHPLPDMVALEADIDGLPALRQVFVSQAVRLAEAVR